MSTDNRLPTFVIDESCKSYVAVLDSTEKFKLIRGDTKRQSEAEDLE